MKKDTTWRVNQYSYEAKNILTLDNKFRIMDSPYCDGNKKIYINWQLQKSRNKLFHLAGIFEAK